MRREKHCCARIPYKERLREYETCAVSNKARMYLDFSSVIRNMKVKSFRCAQVIQLLEGSLYHQQMGTEESAGSTTQLPT